MRTGIEALDDSRGLELGFSKYKDIQRTSSISINIRDLTLDDCRIQESLVRHPQPLFRLVLFSFSILPRRCDCLESGGRDSVVYNARAQRTVSRSYKRS